jgi:hypothetical protein
MPETFDLAALLTVATDRFLTRMDEVYRIVDHVTGTNHMTHQLPRACREIRPWLLQQYPWLADDDLVLPLELCEAGEAPVLAWLAEKKAQHGAEFAVEPMPAGMYTPREPIAEMLEMIGPDKPVIVVET